MNTEPLSVKPCQVLVDPCPMKRGGFHHRRLREYVTVVTVLANKWTKGSSRNNFTFCCRPPGPLARRERRAIPGATGAVCKERATSQRACGPQPEGARRR